MPFSCDLRTRAVSLLRAGSYTSNQVARIFDISRAALLRWDLQERKTGDLGPRKRQPSEKAARNNPIVHETLTVLVEERNDATLAEYRDALMQRCGIHMGISSICTLLQKLDLRRKKRRACMRA